MTIRERPLFTDTFSKVEDFVPEIGSAYIFGSSAEERSAHYHEWESKTENIVFLRIIDQQPTSFKVVIDDVEEDLSLRSSSRLQELLSKVSNKTIYLDITGLSHHIWAPLLKIALTSCNEVNAVYVEPTSYRYSATPKEGEIFDLSERISGISPIPGFISFREPAEEEKVCLVPLLGFEGTRFAYIVEQVQPPGDKILPIIGVPGFRPEYPFYTYHGNQLPLMRTHAYRSVKFATANCPFSLFYALSDITSDYPDNLIKIALIGTKPHALGAVLYHIANHEHVELVYDHPIRKDTRTEGASRLLLYHVSAFVRSKVSI